MSVARMPLVNKVLWYNDGSATLSGIASSSVRWFTPYVQGTAGVVTGSPDATTWQKIDVRGCDTLQLQWSSKVTTVGGLGTASSGAMSVCAIGVAHDDGNGVFKPYGATITPASMVASTSRERGVLWALPEETGDSAPINATVAAACFNNFAHSAIGLVYNAAVTLGDTAISVINLGKRPILSTNVLNTANSNIYAPFSIKGLSAVWIALAYFQTFTAVTGSPAIAGEWRAIGWGEPRN